MKLPPQISGPININRGRLLMGYVEQNLMAGEEVIYRAKLHWKVFLLPIILLLVGVLILWLDRSSNDTQVLCCGGGWGALVLLAGLIVGLLATISYTTSEFALTDKRVLVKVGFVKRHSLELLLTKIEGIGVDQGILGRILGYGTIVVAGTGGTKEPFKNIADPLEFRRQVQSQISGS
jgi:uncharacterized membrane protein YdbT with pleckstrin-like domain